MSKLVRFYLLLGAIAFAFSMGVTAPTIDIWFISHVSKEIYAASCAIETAVMALALSALGMEKVRQWGRKWFAILLILDVLFFIALNTIGQDAVAVRFLGMAVAMSFTSTFLYTIMDSVINRNIAGDDLTGFQAKLNAARMWSALAGGTLAVVGTFTVTEALIVQTLGYIVYALTDYFVFSRLQA